MRKILYTTMTALLLCTMSSCDEGFLDTVAKDTYNEANFWQTEVHAVAAVNGCYAVLMSGSLHGSNGQLKNENFTPNAYDMGGNVALAEGRHDAGNIDLFYSRWDANYEGIGRTNNLLSHIDQVDMDADLKERIRGEALFLRAYFYSNLVNLFGGVPLILDAPNFKEQKNLPRNTRDEVLTQILADLDKAAEILPESYSNGDKGRATRGAALGLRARVLLYEGMWSEAAAAAKAVIDSDYYSLFSDYRGLFLVENEGNDEVIFDVQFKDPEYSNNYDIILELQQNIAPLPDLVNSYLMKDGLPEDQSSWYDAAMPYENRDPRLLQTIVVPGYMFRGGIVPDTKYFSTGYGFKKYTSYKDNVKTNDFIRSEINYIILRYADILLMYAEAQNEAVGPDESVYAVLHEIRLRAGMPDVPADLSKDEMREAIRHERRIELAGEGLYYNDIRRWGTAETVMNADVFNIRGEVLQSRSFNGKRDYLWPIHTSTIQENPALEQNPGY